MTTAADWHNRRYKEGRDYYMVGNGWITGLIQIDRRGPGAPLALIVQDPNQFGLGWCQKPDTPLFDVPHKLCTILNRDLRLAGIAKRDDRGGTLDVHALRHTFGTLLSKGGVAPRTAQAAMRHSKLDLTMNVYTDPALLDVRGALDALPTLPLGGEQPEGVTLPATGTEGGFSHSVYSVAPIVAPTSDTPITPEPSWNMKSPNYSKVWILPSWTVPPRPCWLL